MQVTLFVLLPLCNQNHDIGIIKIQTYVTYVAAKKRFKDINKKQDCPVPLDVTGPISLVHGTFFVGFLEASKWPQSWHSSGDRCPDIRPELRRYRLAELSCVVNDFCLQFELVDVCVDDR